MRCTYCVIYVTMLQVCLIQAEFVRHSAKKILIALSDYLILKAQVTIVCFMKKKFSFFVVSSVFCLVFLFVPLVVKL